MKYYTVFLSQNDDIIASGTARECAKQLGKTLNGFHSLVSKNTLGIHKKYVIVKDEVEFDHHGNIIESEETESMR